MRKHAHNNFLSKQNCKGSNPQLSSSSSIFFKLHKHPKTVNFTVHKVLVRSLRLIKKSKGIKKSNVSPCLRKTASFHYSSIPSEHVILFI